MQRTSTPRVLILFALAMAMLASACGSDDDPAIDDLDDTSAQTVEVVPDTDGGDPEDNDDEFAEADENRNWERVNSRDDLIQLQPGTAFEVVVPDDDPVLLVRYEAAAEPCAGAKVTVTELADAVTVEFQTGLDPNAAATTCIAGVFPYEIAVVLSAPVGDRSIEQIG